MQKYISLRQFAKMAGVSPATVSHVYTAPSTVAKSTVQHVLELAEKVGFTPSAVARAAFGGATRSIGILASSVYQALNQSIQDTLIAADYLPILITMEGPAPDAVSRLLKHHVDGLILGACNDRLDFSELCARQIRRLPTVILETKRPNLQADSVLSDDYDGGRQAALHLLELGHRHFGVLNSVQDLPAISMDRILGFRDAVRSAGGFLEEHHLLELDPPPPPEPECGNSFKPSGRCLPLPMRQRLFSVQRIILRSISARRFRWKEKQFPEISASWDSAIWISVNISPFP